MKRYVRLGNGRTRTTKVVLPVSHLFVLVKVLQLLCTLHLPLNKTADFIFVGWPEPDLLSMLLVSLNFCLCVPMRFSSYGLLSQQAADSRWLVAHSHTMRMRCLLYLLCVSCYLYIYIRDRSNESNLLHTHLTTWLH